MKKTFRTLDITVGNNRGSVLPPLVLWMLGVPGVVAILLWVFFFRG